MIKVQDDWLPKGIFDFERKALDESQFEQIWAGDKDFHVVKPSEKLMNYLQLRLEEEFGGSVDIILSFFRLATEELDDDWRIHSDLNIMGQRPTHAGVLYFSSHEPDGNLFGTAFWSHIEHGSKLSPETTDEEYDRLLGVDANDVDKWKLDSIVSAKENRLLLYEASLFHSKYPNKAWGSGSQDGRVVLVMFLNVI